MIRLFKNRSLWQALVLAPLVLLALGALAWVLAPEDVRSDDSERTVLGDLISRVLSTDNATVSVGAVDGALSSDATIRNVVISDRQGPWLRLNEARLIWRRLALLSGRLEIDRLEIGTLELIRRPVPPEREVTPPGDEPLLPQLPVEVIVRAFQLKDLSLGEAFAGVAAQIGANGEARLGDPAQGLNFRLEAKRLDAPGQFNVQVAFTPADKHLKVQLHANEPAGGLVARLASIPGLPPMKLDVDGAGPLDDFTANLNFDGGPDLSARGSARLTQQDQAQQQVSGGGRVMALDMAARVSGVLPAPVAPVFAGDTRLGGRIFFNSDGAFWLDDVAVQAEAARLAISGGMTSGKQLDVRIMAGAVPNDGGVLRTGNAEIGKLNFDARITGQPSMPTVKASLELARAKLPTGSIAAATATLDAEPTGVIGERGTRLNVRADAAASGIALADKGLDAAIGDKVTLTLRAAVGRYGTAHVDVFNLATASGAVDFKGVAGNRRLDGVLSAKISDLARLRLLTGMRISGALDLGAKLTGEPRFNRIRAELNGGARDLGTGIEAVDGLSGGRVTLTGAVEMAPRGGFGFDNLTLAGTHASMRVNGQAREDQSAIEALASIADLRYADRRMTGRGELQASLTGPLTRPDAAATLSIRDGSMLGRPAPLLQLAVKATDLTGNLVANASLTGELDRKPVKGVVEAARLAAGGWDIRGLDFAMGSVTARGALAIDAANLAKGQLTVRAGSLDDISALALRQLAGQLNADLTLESVDGGQNVAVRADGTRMRFGEIRADRLNADLRASDVLRRPSADGFVNIDNAVVGGQPLTRARLEARGAGAATDITLAAAAAGFDLDAKARLTPGDQTRVDVSSFTARRGSHRIGLAGPASLVIVDGGVDIRQLAVALGSGRLTAQGRLGKTLDLNVGASAVPLSVAEIFAPGLGLTGVLNGEATVRGSSLVPSGQWRLNLSGVSAAAVRAAGLPPATVAASGALDGAGRTSLNATVTAGRIADLRITGSAPLDPGGRFDIGARGRIDLGVANVQLAPAGRRLTGSANLDVRVGGSVTHPQITGGGALSGGAFSDAVTGVRLTNINGQIIARGQEIVVQRIVASTPNGGSLAVTGNVRVDPAAGFPGSFRITGSNALLMNDGMARAAADLNLAAAGPLASRPRISGTISIRSLNISVPNQLPGSLRPLANVRQIAPTPQAKARLALEQRARVQGPRSTPFDAVLDLVVTSQNTIQVSGRGINAVLGGQLRIAGTLSAPAPTGGFTMRSGSFDLGSQTLDFTRGQVTFSGTLSPELDFIAETIAGGVTARIQISGPASDPAFDFSSSPAMSREEVISRILFGQSAGELSGLEALQLAQIAAQFSGDGDSAFDSLRRTLGLGGSDMDGDSNQGFLARVSRALGKRIRFSVKPGTSPETTGLGVNVNVTRHIRVQGLVGATGNTSVNIGAEWEY